MRQFDVVENANARTAGRIPFLVVLQSHHLSSLDTVFLAPVIRDTKRLLTELDVEIEVGGERLALSVPEAAGIPRETVGRVVGSAAQHEDAIRRAIERLLSGF